MANTRTVVWCTMVPLLLAIEANLFGAGTSQVTATPTTIYLHTEGIPYKQRVDNDYQYLLMRELARQGFVVAAQLDFGLVVRDQTLGESMPADSEAVNLILSERADSQGNWRLKLFRIDADATADRIDELWPSKSLWEASFQYETSVNHLYKFAAALFDCASFDEFETAILAAGISPNIAKPADSSGNPSEVEFARWEQALLNVDYVVQFGTIREIQQAIERFGESAELLSILARAYANLSLLTDHQANAVSHAFAARSLILTARARRQFELSPPLLLSELYVWSIVGQHYTALEIQKGLGEAADDFESSETPWSRLMRPYLQGDLPELKRIASEESKLQPWAIRLWVELVKGYRYQQWMLEAYELVNKHTPASYGSYAFLAARGDSLSLTRQAAFGVPGQFARQLPESLKLVKDLPATVREVSQQSSTLFIFGIFGSAEPFSQTPTKIARSLRNVSNDESSSAISWSALAYFIEEGLFVQGANYLKVSQNAVETPLDSEANAVLKTIPNHRYSDWIESYKFTFRTESQARWDLLKGLRVSDIRGNMLNMWMAARYARYQADPDEYLKDSNPWFRPCVDFTLQGIINNSALGGWASGDQSNDYYNKLHSRLFQIVVPESELNTRFEIQSSESASIQDLARWEKKLEGDPTAFMLIADRYVSLFRETELESLLGEAIRCYSKSLAILPNSEPARKLAQVYLDRKDFEQWEKVLVDFLDSEFPDVGLERAHVSSDLARGYIVQSRWRDAKQHAVDAGNTYSGWGLAMASRATEGLAEWKESEAWIRATAENYPSSSAFQWYFWCRRTGRGDVNAAQSLAQQFFDQTESNDLRGKLNYDGAFYLLEGDLRAAKNAYEQQFAVDRSTRLAVLVAQITRDLEDEAAAVKSIGQMLAIIGKIPGENKALLVGSKLLEQMRQGAVTSTNVEELAADIEQLQPYAKCFYLYALARDLDYRKQEEQAVRLYKMALVYFVDNEIDSTFAGAELSRRFGTSREVNESYDARKSQN